MIVKKLEDGTLQILADVSEQANWDAKPGDKAYILNKPTHLRQFPYWENRGTEDLNINNDRYTLRYEDVNAHPYIDEDVYFVAVQFNSTMFGKSINAFSYTFEGNSMGTFNITKSFTVRDDRYYLFFLEPQYGRVYVLNDDPPQELPNEVSFSPNLKNSTFTPLRRSAIANLVDNDFYISFDGIELTITKQGSSDLRCTIRSTTGNNKNVVVRRVSIYNSSIEHETNTSLNLSSTPVVIDSVIYTNSNETIMYHILDHDNPVEDKWWEVIMWPTNGRLKFLVSVERRA